MFQTTRSADGTVIAYERAGDGPPLVVAVGAFCDRKTFVPPADLTGRFTVCTYDRRGRGDSGDGGDYSPDLEVADLAAVIAAVVAAGRRADAVRFWMTDVTGAPTEILPRMESSPMWPGLQALAHTLPYDLALSGDQGIPVDYLAKIAVPVLVLGGARSPDWFRR